jgi:hypothetical protein
VSTNHVFQVQQAYLRRLRSPCGAGSRRRTSFATLPMSRAGCAISAGLVAGGSDATTTQEVATVGVRGNPCTSDALLGRFGID